MAWKTNGGTKKTDNKNDDDGVGAIAEMLETNTTLTALGVAGEQQEKNNRAKNSVNKCNTMSKQEP